VKLKFNFSKSDIVLFSIIGALVLIILFGTVIGLVSRKAAPGKNLRDADPDPTPREIENLNKKLDDKIAAYTGLGTIRCITAPENEEDIGTAVVITPWLSYPEGDTVFFEELARKRLIITGIFTSYFGAYTKVELLSRTEDKIKEDILEQINEQMSLGKISGIYLTDYIFIE
jgi:flagellar FliL protein